MVSDQGNLMRIQKFDAISKDALTMSMDNKQHDNSVRHALNPFKGQVTRIESIQLTDAYPVQLIKDDSESIVNK